MTNQVLILDAKLILCLTLAGIGLTAQLLMFALVAAFFNGSPYLLSVQVSIYTLICMAIVFCFIRVQHSRPMLVCGFCLLMGNWWVGGRNLVEKINNVHIIVVVSSWLSVGCRLPCSHHRKVVLDCGRNRQRNDIVVFQGQWHVCCIAHDRTIADR